MSVILKITCKAIKHNKNHGPWSQLERGELSLEQFYSPFAKEVSNLLPKENSIISADMIEDFMTNLSIAMAKVNIYFFKFESVSIFTHFRYVFHNFS